MVILLQEVRTRNFTQPPPPPALLSKAAFKRCLLGMLETDYQKFPQVV